MSDQKNIPELRFPGFDGELECQKIKESFLLISGQHLNPDEYTTQINNKEPYFTGPSDFTNRNEELSKWVIKKGKNAIKDDIIITVKGNGVGTMMFLHLHKVALGRQLMAIRSENESTSFLYPYLNRYKFQFEKLAMGNLIPGLSRNDILEIKIWLPQLPEQQKIASFFTAIDKKISQLKQKKTLLEQYKKGVMQKIFSQQIRFRDENGQEFPKWETKKVGSIIEEYRVITKSNNEYEVLTSSNKGLMLQTDYYGENRITERENIGFNVLPEGYITYRSRSDNGIFTFNLNNIGIKGIVSKYYPVFKIKDGSNYFFVEYLNSNFKIISQYSIGTSQKVFPLSAFNSISLDFPSPLEQKKIENFLSSIDNKINHTQTQIENAERWKKGLLQKMFV